MLNFKRIEAGKPDDQPTAQNSGETPRATWVTDPSERTVHGNPETGGQNKYITNLSESSLKSHSSAPPVQASISPIKADFSGEIYDRALPDALKK